MLGYQYFCHEITVSMRKHSTNHALTEITEEIKPGCDLLVEHF